MDKVKVEEKRKRSAFSRPSLPLPGRGEGD
jgi:hypothetical protein